MGNLSTIIKKKFPERKGIHLVSGDCNEKIVAMAKYMKTNPNVRSLTFVDPFGMAINWETLEACKGLGIDMWILVPTGIGVNRFLKRDGQIDPAWLHKLEKFLGMSSEEIKQEFYKVNTTLTLFGPE